MDTDTGDWFKCYRKAFSDDDVFWGEPRERTRWEAWMDLVQMAAWKDHKQPYRGAIVSIKRGQVPTSQRRLADRWRWGRQKVRSFLELLEEEGRVRAETVSDVPQGMTLLTVVNYERYQSGPHSEPSGQPTESPEIKGNGRNGQPTEQPTDNPQITQAVEGIRKGEGDNGAHAKADTALGRAVLVFCRRAGSQWSIQASPDEWVSSLDYQGVNLSRELQRAGDWYEEALASGKKQPVKSPTQFLHNWLKKAEADAESGRPANSPTHADLRGYHDE